MNAPQNRSELSRDAVIWSAEAEQSLIGSVLNDNRALDRAQVDTSDFFDARNRAIWGAILTLSLARKPVDPITVFESLQSRGEDELAGGLPYINALFQSVTSSRNVGRYAEIVKDKSALRELRGKLLDGLETTAGEGDAAAKVAEIVGSLSELQRVSVKSSPRHLSEIAIARTEHYENLSRGKVQPGMPTHIPKLDDMLTGGLKSGKLYILAARPSVGKSSLAQHIALTLAKDGNKALFLSQEMPAYELADRAVANLGRIDYGALQSGKLSPEDWTRVSDSCHELGALPYHVDDQPQLKVLDIRLKAQMVPGLKLLVLDYLQLCASTRKDGNRNSEIEEISRGLKALAMDLDIPVIALSQLNRKVEERAGREPNLADLRDSGAIEQDADTVIFLWPISERLVGCKVDKNRGGKKGRFGLHFEGEFQRWSESTADIDFKPREINSSGKNAKGFDDER